LLDADLIKSNFTAGRIGREIIVYKSTSSTNDIAAEYANGGEKNDGFVVLAEQQTAGRGRRANKWLSQTGKSILCSILIRDTGITSNLIPLVSAVAAAEAIDKTISEKPRGLRAHPTKRDCRAALAMTSGIFRDTPKFVRVESKIKWPNDIFLGGRKVAGILIDGIVRAGQKFYVIGIGINCHQTKEDFCGELKDTATSIDIQSGDVCDRNKIAAELLTNLEHYLNVVSDNPASIIEKWQSRNMLLGKRVTIEHNGEKFTGKCLGIEPTEGLIVQLECGENRMFDAVFTMILKSWE
jgi:BirA family biotin operon repressor/biotin-[acetyl-CoA-carboxylase] ligase